MYIAFSLDYSFMVMPGLKLHRLGLVMESEPGNPGEAEGVLNPSAIRGPDGGLYLFPRVVAKGNYSRIAMARVLFDGQGEPTGVERLGIALSPESDYETHSEGRGGCEDPRITYVEPLQSYLMTYTALSRNGPRIAIAVSRDLFHWKRLGLATFAPLGGIDFVNVDNKDACIFPVPIPNHQGKLQLGMLHRPLFPGTRPEQTALRDDYERVDTDRESIWISYCPMPEANTEYSALGLFNSHHRLAHPVSSWEALKIGGGTPPILTPEGCLILYHGVSKSEKSKGAFPEVSYAAGMMLLSKEHPRHILYRSPEPILQPITPKEIHGVVPNVVFPTGIDRRDDLSLPDRFDVYYGMADSHIGVASFNLAEFQADRVDRPDGQLAATNVEHLQQAAGA
jgi:beta-1,2-mannobiose phosphorylase / 1,2-beta-oligomannan phosphorylase